MKIHGWKGARVRLIPPDRTLHLENALAWMNDPEVAACLKYNMGATRRQEEIFFDRMEVGTGTDYLWAIHDEAERHIGFIGLHEINWRHRWATGGLFLGEKSAWGRGYATEAVRLRTRIAFDQLNLHRIEGHTFNPAMMRVFEKAGYQREGLARAKFLRGGRWHDVPLYSILDSDEYGSRNP